MTKRKKRRKPMGQPLPPATDEDAEITPEDIERAREWVRKYGSPRLVALLEAKPDDSGDFE